MGWYFASDNENGKPCLICRKLISGKSVSQEDFQKEDFKETRDQVYLTDSGTKHADCVWKANEENQSTLDNFFGKLGR